MGVRSAYLAFPILAALAVLAVAGCGGGGGEEGCTGNSDCPSGYECDLSTGVCVPVQDGQPCSRHEDCPIGEYCIDLRCRPDGAGCTTDDQCPLGLTCVNRECVGSDGDQDGEPDGDGEPDPDPDIDEQADVEPFELEYDGEVADEAEECRRGTVSCPCMPNQVCLAPLICIDNVCRMFADGDDEREVPCIPGERDCPCNPDGSCDSPELNCINGVCLGPADGDGEQDRPADGDQCAPGSRYCACLPGGGCDPGLNCVGDLCFPIGTDGDTGGDGDPEADGDAGGSKAEGERCATTAECLSPLVCTSPGTGDTRCWSRCFSNAECRYGTWCWVSGACMPGTCTPAYTGSGCPAGEWCQAVNGTGRCLPRGGTPENGFCINWYDCAEALTCTLDMPVGSRNCLPACEMHSDCAWGRACFDMYDDDGSRTGGACRAGDCNPDGSIGCMPSHYCAGINGTGICVRRGIAAEGDPCTGTWDCQYGLLCGRRDGESATRCRVGCAAHGDCLDDQICLPLSDSAGEPDGSGCFTSECDPGGPDHCPTGRFCYPRRPLAGTCEQRCTLFGSDCAADRHCVPLLPIREEYHACRPAGEKGEGERCANDECGAGLVCLTTAGDPYPTCYRLCRLEDDCIAGTQACQPIENVDAFGLCPH